MSDLNDNTMPRSEIPIVTSPLFPLLYWSLYTMQRHSPRTTKSIFAEYDYIIVGAGSAGSTLAGRLSEIPCVKILLLEAGIIPPILTEIPALVFLSSDIYWNYFTVPQRHAARLYDGRRVGYTVGKVIGGSSTINGMMYVRGSRHIYDQWHQFGATGWAYSDVIPYFKKMEKNENPDSINIPFHGFDGPLNVETGRSRSIYMPAMVSAMREISYDLVDPNGPTQLGIYDIQFTTKRNRRYSTAKAYLVPVDNRRNIHIVVEALVTKVIFNNKQAVGIEFTSNGKQYEIKALREIIISAGTLHTPKILMLSGIGPKTHLQKLGIQVVADLSVGQNFHDHLRISHYYTLNNPLPEEQVSLPLSIIEYIKNGTGSLGNYLFYNLFASTKNHLAVNAIPDLQLYPIISPGIGFFDNLSQEVYDKVYGPYVNRTTFGCMATLIRPKSRGFVTINSINIDDMHLIDPNILSHPDDIKTLVEGLKMCDRIANTSSLKRFRVKPIETKFPGCENYARFSDDYLKCEIESIAVPIFHAVGTAKMGHISDPSTVVDSYLKVKGVKGLRVVDASVMPIVTTGNTNIPTIMIAEKAADIIKKDIQCSKLYQHFTHKEPHRIHIE